MNWATRQKVWWTEDVGYNGVHYMRPRLKLLLVADIAQRAQQLWEWEWDLVDEFTMVGFLPDNICLDLFGDDD